MAKQGIPIIDRDYKEIGRYPFNYPHELRTGRNPPQMLRVKAPKTKAGKNKNGGPDRLFTFDGESAEGGYWEVTRFEDFAL